MNQVSVICLLVCALAACRPPKAGQTLAESVRAYNEGLRWERFANAAVYVPPRERTQFVDDADARANDLRITEYEIVNVEKASDRTAEVLIKISWYLDSEGLLRETQAKQTWERQGKTWLIVDEIRARGAAMPGLREPIEAPPAQAAVRETAI